MDKKVQRNFLWIALLVLGTIGILARHNRTAPYQTASGLIFGTVYNITYQYDGDLKAEIETELKRFDGSLSPFNYSYQPERKYYSRHILCQRIPPQYGNIPGDRRSF